MTRGWLRLLRRLRGLGFAGERVAVRHLRRKGYAVLACNLRFKAGEIDILCRDPATDQVVVVEVKSGSGAGPYRPEVHVNAAKQLKLTQLAQLAVKRLRLGSPAVRFDVVGVDWPQGREPVVRHHVGAFTSRV